MIRDVRVQLMNNNSVELCACDEKFSNISKYEKKIFENMDLIKIVEYNTHELNYNYFDRDNKFDVSI